MKGSPEELVVGRNRPCKKSVVGKDGVLINGGVPAIEKPWCLKGCNLRKRKSQPKKRSDFSNSVSYLSRRDCGIVWRKHGQDADAGKFQSALKQLQPRHHPKHGTRFKSAHFGEVFFDRIGG